MKRIICFAIALVGILNGFSSCSEMDDSDSDSGSKTSLFGDYVCQKIVVVVDGTTSTLSGEELGQGMLEDLFFYYELDFRKDGKCTTIDRIGCSPYTETFFVKNDYIYFVSSGMDIPVFKIKSKKGKTLVLEQTEAYMAFLQLSISLNYDANLESAVATYQKK